MIGICIRISAVAIVKPAPSYVACPHIAALQICVRLRIAAKIEIKKQDTKNVLICTCCLCSVHLLILSSSMREKNKIVLDKFYAFAF